MSTTNAPFGLKPIWHPSGQVRPRLLANGIASGYASNILQFQPVAYNTSGQIVAADALNALCGTFVGCTYVEPVTGRPIFTNRWLANTTFVAGSLMAYFYDDPMIEYAIQADGSVAQSLMSEEVNFTNITAGNSTTGFSAATCSATAAPAEGQLRVLDKLLNPENDWGDTYTALRVQIAMHQYVAPLVGF